jgi:non-specific serine/threonine protein kinase/serine/threonine-protein kinase
METKRELLALLEQSGSERAASLAKVRSTSPQRASDLEHLLRAACSEFLETPAWKRVAPPESPLVAPPERIGPWRIEGEIGRGGMGTVYRARRDDGAFMQTVAIKLISTDLASAAMRRRFDGERHILASLEHPNIARLLDAGTTADGAPYLALEYVAGEPVDAYCNTRALNLEQRLAMFRQICGAVLSAHQKLVLHRDIKTANVLVDANGAPKLLDFGIAKLLVPDSERSDNTMLGIARPLTLEWSSPEQLRGETLSTASDVYSLGVLLFVLLTGRRPYASEGRSPHVLATAIDAAGPPPLRADVRSKTPPGVTPRNLRGDVERIVHKALAPDLNERYSNVTDLDADIGRLLAGQPVQAHPRSFTYRFGKLLLRHNVASAAIFIAAAGLLAATVFSMRAAAVAAQERQRAERRFADVKRIANVVLFDLNDTLANISGTLAARQLLVENALRYLDDLARDTGRESELLTELASAYERIAEVQGMPSWPNQGRTGDALPSLQRALELHRRATAESADTIRSRLSEARVLTNIASILAARGDLRAALLSHRQGAAALEAIPANGRNAEWQLLLTRVQVAIGDDVWELGDVAASAREYGRARATADIGRMAFPQSVLIEREVGVVEQRLGDAAAVREDWQQARVHHTASLAVDEALLRREPSSLELQRDLGTDYSRVGAVAFMLGEHQEALAAHQQALALRQRLTLADPTDARAQDDAAESHLQNARALAALGRVREAQVEASRATPAGRGLVQRDSGNARLRASLANGLVALGRCEAIAGRRESALSRIAEARAIRAQLAADSPDFKLTETAVAALETLDAAIRAGRAPSSTLDVASAWD